MEGLVSVFCYCSRISKTRQFTKKKKVYFLTDLEVGKVLAAPELSVRIVQLLYVE